jgi:hypothetical protein
VCTASTWVLNTRNLNEGVPGSTNRRSDPAVWSNNIICVCVHTILGAVGGAHGLFRARKGCGTVPDEYIHISGAWSERNSHGPWSLCADRSSLVGIPSFPKHSTSITKDRVNEGSLFCNFVENDRRRPWSCC